MGLQHISMRNTAFLLLLFLCSCANSGSDSDPALPARFELLTAEATGVDFTNRVENSEDFNIFSYRNFYNGGGVAIGDLNNDGLLNVRSQVSQ